MYAILRAEVVFINYRRGFPSSKKVTADKVVYVLL